MKLTISLLHVKFASATFTANFSAVKSLNSGVVIYLLRSGILFSTAVRVVVVATLA